MNDDKIRIFISNNAKMSRGKYAAHAVHAALVAAGVDYPGAVVVLGAPKADVEKMATTIHDEGRTELEPGTLTAGTDWKPADREAGIHRVRADDATAERVAEFLYDEAETGGAPWAEYVGVQSSYCEVWRDKARTVLRIVTDAPRDVRSGQ